MKKIYLLFCLTVFALLLAGGFFILQINNSSASDNILLYHDGNLASSTGWLYQNCDQGAPSGDNYIVMTKSTSTLISPVINIDDYSFKRLNYQARTYGGVVSSSAQITLSVSVDNGASWIIIGAAAPISSTISSQPEIDLSAYSGNIQIKFETLSATGSRGVGIDAIKLSATLPNQPPVPIAISSAGEADINEEIAFDGRSSTDDNTIIDWYWDFGDGRPLVFASTTVYSYAASGTYYVYLNVTDGEFSVTSSPLTITVNDPIATTFTPTSTPSFSPLDIAINEVYPAGTPEWLELYNNTSSTISLIGWTLLDKYGDGWRTTTSSADVLSKSFLILTDIAGSLNNTGDTLILKDPSGQIIDQATYGDFSNKKDMSWARTVDGSGGFSETITPTEGAANVITAKPASSGGGGYSYSPVAITTTTSTVTTTSVTSTWEKLIGKVIINELYPNPPGSDTNDEFIELKNISESDIDLTGLVLADASKNKFLIKASSSATSTNMIPAGGFKVFKRTQTDLALNNTGVESVFLKTADLQVIDQVDYVGENEEGVSYSRADDGKWRWVKTPTPGEDNASDELYPDRENQAVLDDSAVADIKLVATVKSTAKGKATVNTTLEELKNYSSGDRVRVQGIVSVAPGVLGSQYFYLAGSGVQVYCYKKDFSELKIGDLIEVVGEISDTATVGRRIKITNRNDIKFISHQDAPQPHAITSADLEEYEGSLIKISGTVLDIKSRNITIDDGNDEIKVYVNNQIEFKDIDVKEGDQLTITGIVGRISSGWRIMPRDLSDFQVETGQVQGAYATSSSVNFNSLSWYLGAIIAFLSGLVAILWFRLRKNKRHNV